MSVAIQVVLLLVLPIWMGRVAFRQWKSEGRKRTEGLGLSVRWSTPAELIGGAILGAAMVGAVVACGRVTDALELGRVDQPDPRTGEFVVIFAVLALIEELLFRSLLLNGLIVTFRGRWVRAVAASALLFGLVHLTNPNTSALSLLGNVIGGAVYSLAFLARGNLWFPVGLHFAWNAALGPLAGFPVSGERFGGLFAATRSNDLLLGGSFGPEAGLLGIAVRGSVTVGLGLWAWRRLAPVGGLRA